MENAQVVWDFLKSKGLNDFAVAGIWGNIKAESNFKPNNLQNSYEKKLGYTDESYTEAVDSGKYDNFVKDAAGYGLVQWTYWSRKQGLLDYCQAAKKSIGDITAQLEYMWQELQGYSAVINVLKRATSVREASDAVLLKYERPADQSETAQKRRAGYGEEGYAKYAKVNSSKGDTKRMIKTNLELVAKLKEVAKNYKTLYVMGCFGAPLTASNKQRYTNNHEYNRRAERTKMINAACADTFGFDCVCLIKGVLWGWNGDKNATYGGASYASNGVPDIGADGMITKCSGVSTDFSNIEVGEAVWLSGHIGVYIGDGLAVECTPSFNNNVQITAVKNIGTKAGYNARQWTKHGKLPYITYEKTAAATVQPDKQPEQKPANNGSYKVGDVVEFTGSTHYTNTNAVEGKACRPGKAKVTALANGKHTVHLVHTDSASNVYGWVDTADIKTSGGKSTEELAKEVLQGKWGNGADRKNRLEAAGYSYAAVQAKVNELCR